MAASLRSGAALALGLVATTMLIVACQPATVDEGHFWIGIDSGAPDTGTGTGGETIPPEGSGGQPGSGTGGDNGSGGAIGTGGNDSGSGGQTGTGGVTGTGGDGSGSGGSDGSGGSTVTTGSGGDNGTGGATGTGGSGSGGTSSPGTGGTSSTGSGGAMTGSGGAASTGGRAGTGGVVGTGGAIGTGGAMGSGGATTGSGGSSGVLTGTLKITVTTKAAGGRYQPDNVGAIWIADSSTKFVKSLFVWGSQRRREISHWVSATTAAGSAQNVVDAVTSATYSSHGTRTASWNGTNVSKTLVPDGAYKVCFELTDGTDVYQCVDFNKSRTAQTQMPADNTSFTKRTIEYTP